MGTRKMVQVPQDPGPKAPEPSPTVAATAAFPQLLLLMLPLPAATAAVPQLFLLMLPTPAATPAVSPLLMQPCPIPAVNTAVPLLLSQLNPAAPAAGPPLQPQPKPTPAAPAAVPPLLSQPLPVPAAVWQPSVSYDQTRQVNRGQPPVRSKHPEHVEQGAANIKTWGDVSGTPAAQARYRHWLGMGLPT